MYWLVEDEEQIEVLINSGYKEAFIEVIPYNNNIHPVLNDISLVYLRPINARKGFMVCVTHSEGLNALNARINALISKFDILYCRDKKEILHYFPNKALYDINTSFPTYIPTYTKAHDFYYQKHGELEDVNLIIPMVKHYEYCEQIYNDLKANINNKPTKYDEFFNNTVSLVFNYLERSGIQIHKPTFEEYFHKINDKRVYTQYNLRTTTTRPSNKFKGVNYAALNKKNGERRCFIPKNDEFIELDVVAYHPSIAASLIDYTFPTADIHTHFSEMYGVDRSKAKELTFKQLYGGIFKEYKDLPFFRDLQTFMDKLWYQFQNEGYMECPTSKYRFYRDKLENMNSNKLFNYLLQNEETSRNTLALWDIFRIFTPYKSNIVLYTYDSILIDYDKEEDIIDDIQQIFTNHGLNTSKTKGYDYNFN